MVEEMYSKQHEFRGFPEFPGLSCIGIATAKEIAMYNDKLAPETEPRSVNFSQRKARNFVDTSDLSEKQ